MMRRIDRELDLPSHIARKIKARFEKLRKEKENIENRLKALEKQHEIMDHQAIKDSLATIGDVMLQLNKRLNDLDSRLKAIEEKLASQA